MSQVFKSKFDQLRENDPTGTNPETETSTDHYPQHGNVRNLCFVQLDGRRLFLNYAYLVSGEYIPQESSIILEYTTHKITLKGHNLERLYYQIIDHLPKQIVCEDDRYSSTKKTLADVYQISINS